MFRCFFLSLSLLSCYARSQVPAAPAVFAPGIISTDDYETHPAFSPTGDTVYFLRCAADLSRSTIYVSEKKSGRWSKPQVASFSGRYFDCDPFVTADGRIIYFISSRPAHSQDTTKDWDIWRVHLEGDGWGAPERLPAPVNSEADEHFPTLVANGTLYFSSQRPGSSGGSDIYYSHLQNNGYSNVQNIGPVINSNLNNYEPFLTPDESFLIFMAAVPDGLQHADLYFSHKTDTGWKKPEKLPAPVNSDATEWGARLSPDGKWLYFGSTRPRTGAGNKKDTLSCDIYYIALSAILKNKK